MSSSADAQQLEMRWAAVVEHRDRALRVARARCHDRGAVDDCVQEAMARVVAMPSVELSTVGPLLSTVVAHVAADVGRDAARCSALGARLTRAQPAVPAAEDAACDQAEARWLGQVAERLPTQDRAVLLLRADGLSVAEVAAELDITYKAAEAAFTRARKVLRAAWRATLGVLAVLLGRPGRDNERPVLLCAATTVLTLACALTWWPSQPPAVDALPPRPHPFPMSQPEQPTVTTQEATPQRVLAPRANRQAAASVAAVSSPTTGPAPVAPPVRTPVVTAEGPVVGPVDAGDTRLVYEDRDETVTETIDRCASDLVLTPFEISCG